MLFNMLHRQTFECYLLECIVNSNKVSHTVLVNCTNLFSIRKNYYRIKVHESHRPTICEHNFISKIYSKYTKHLLSKKYRACKHIFIERHYRQIILIL